MSAEELAILRAKLDKMSDKMNRLEIDVVTLKSMDNRLGSIEDSIKWLSRLVFGGLVMAVVGFVLQGGLNVVP